MLEKCSWEDYFLWPNDKDRKHEVGDTFLTFTTGNLAPMILSLSEQKENLSKYLGVEIAFNFKLNQSPKSSLKK